MKLTERQRIAIARPALKVDDTRWPGYFRRGGSLVSGLTANR